MKNDKKVIIALIGLMGVGKTTVGAKLAEKLEYYFIDLDQEIEDREKKSIKDIFENEGEKYFRQLEVNLIKEITNRDEKIILSLGGGAFINEENRRVLKDNAITIWLDADINVILYRVSKTNARPLLNQKNKRKILEELINERYPIYKEADFKFDTSEENHEILINRIIKTISNA